MSALAEARVEHSIGVIKRLFGFVKVRYRGLEKNAHRLFVTCALSNLFIARRYLLRWQLTQCVPGLPTGSRGDMKDGDQTAPPRHRFVD